jgi:plastocyanin
MRSAGLVVLAWAAVCVVPSATAAGDRAEVAIQFQAFAPSEIEILPGATVDWSNESERRHTVTADDESFDSGDLFGGDDFAHEYDSAGTFAYHCTVHLGMHGEVDVRRVILDSFGPGPVPAGQRVEVSGRTADPATAVEVERDTGSGFHAVVSATPSGDGTWFVTVPAVSTADYRAVVGSDVSSTQRLLVTDRKVRIRATRQGLDVTVTPPDPNAQVVLEFRQRERFGWWPLARARLDYLSRAGFRVRRRVLARVVLVDRDGWSAVATSPQIRAGQRRGMDPRLARHRRPYQPF